MSGAVTWVGGWGIDLRGGKAQATTASSRKLHDLIKATGEYSIEAWVAPANVVQEQAYIVSYSGGTMARNFTLGQTMYNYDYFNRATTTDANGEPALSTPSADEVLQATLQHVVATYSPVDGRRIYVNGVLTTQADPVPAGLFTDWNDTFALVLGNEVSNDRTWQGVVRMVVIHNRALTQPQIQQNFEAGVGERFYLLFSVSHLINVPQSYVMFEGSQFDSYSYLFNKPTFISLDGSADPDQIRIKGLRIGVNGTEAKVGQAYAPLDRTVTAAGYEPATGFGLAGIGTVVALDKGPSADEFFLTFEQIGTRNHPFVEPAPTPLPPPPDAVPSSEIGLRTFEEISTSMSNMTGVPTTNANVAATYDARARAAADRREHRGLPVLAPGRRRPARDRVLQRAGGRRRPARRVLPGLQLRRAGGHCLRHAGRARPDHGPAGDARGRHGTHDAAVRRGSCDRSGRADRQAHGLRRQLRRGSHGSRGQGGLFGGHRQRQHAAAMRVLQLMKRKSRRGARPSRTLRTATRDHPRPVTRRQFVAQGFVAGAATVIAPTLFGLFANPRAAQAALSPDLEALKASCGIAVQGAGKIPFICFDLAGGANMAGSNVLTGGQGGQRDFLVGRGLRHASACPATWCRTRRTRAARPTTSSRAASASLFHLDSAFVRGILERVSVTTAANVNGAVIPARSENDTGNNPHNPMYGIFRAGADGELLTLIGSESSESGGNSMSPSYLVDVVGPSDQGRARRATSRASSTPASWSACSTRTTRCA